MGRKGSLLLRKANKSRARKEESLPHLSEGRRGSRVLRDKGKEIAPRGNILDEEGRREKISRRKGGENSRKKTETSVRGKKTSVRFAYEKLCEKERLRKGSPLRTTQKKKRIF